MGKIGDSLRRATEAVFTRKPPVSTQKRVGFLKAQLKTTRAVAELLGVSQRTVERYLDGTRRHPPRAIAEAIDREVRARWQPLVRKRAVSRAVTSTGIRIETRAQFGYIAAPGTTDDGRERRITEHLPSEYAERLFEAQAFGAGEEELQDIIAEGLQDIAEGLQEVYFKDGGRRAAGLTVRFNSVDYIETQI